MGQTDLKQRGDALDYTPVTAVAAGAIIIFGGLPFFTKRDIAANTLGAIVPINGEVFDVVKGSDVFAAGDKVFWTPNANPVGGVAGTGAAGLSGPYVLGIVPPGYSAAADAEVVRVKTMPQVRELAIGASTAAAGTTTADAGVLPAATARVYRTSAADGTKGVRIHADDKVTGRELRIANGVSNAVLKVYPPAGGTINGAAADAAVSSVSGKGVILICLDATANTWAAF